MTWRERLDARIDRCECGAWRWDGECRGCDSAPPAETNGALCAGDQPMNGAPMHSERSSRPGHDENRSVA